MMKIKLLVVVGLLLIMQGCSTGNVTSATQKKLMVDYFADNGTGNSLAIVQTPAGIHHEGITYVSYQGPFEDPYIASYNHETKEWLGPFRAGTSELGRREGRTKFDNHGKPTMLIDDEGFIHIFYGGHGGDKHHGVNELGNIHHGANKNSRSKRPLDITEWEEVDNISVFGTYNQAIKMDNGDIYLFYRHGAHRSDWVYQKSVNNGLTFAEPVSFLKHKRRDDIQAVDSWYAFATKGEGDEIIVSFDYHYCWDRAGAPDERGHTTQRHDAHFMTFNTVTNEWKNVENELLPMPLTREVAEVKTKALDTNDQWTFNGAVRLDSNGYPHLVINAGDDIGLKTGGPKQTRHLRWDGEQWVGGASINGKGSGDSRGDIMFGSSNKIEVLLADNDNSDGVIVNYVSQDNGASFIQAKELLRKEKTNFSITTIIQNAHPDALMIVAQKEAGDPNRKIILVGKNGPIKREISNATLEKDTSKFAK